jgi:hypothetical protein
LHPHQLEQCLTARLRSFVLRRSAVIHADETTALNPLERWSREDADLPETYPTGV